MPRIMRRLHFFVTPEDAVLLLQRFEADGPLLFVEMGNFTAVNFPKHLSVADLPDPGIATAGSVGASRGYIVLPATDHFFCPSFLGAAGEERWAPNNAENVTSVRLSLGGVWKDMMIPGIMDTLHNNAAAQGLMQRFTKAMRAGSFTKSGTYWLGPCALCNLNSGMRLTLHGEESPADYSLAPIMKTERTKQ